MAIKFELKLYKVVSKPAHVKQSRVGPVLVRGIGNSAFTLSFRFLKSTYCISANCYKIYLNSFYALHHSVPQSSSRPLKIVLITKACVSSLVARLGPPSRKVVLIASLSLREPKPTTCQETRFFFLVATAKSAVLIEIIGFNLSCRNVYGL